MAIWVYPHRSLDEPTFADGSPVLRPVVPLMLHGDRPDAVAVIDSGSPLSIADADLFAWLGIDVETDEPLYELPNSVGGQFVITPVFDVELTLRPPVPGTPVVSWRMPLGARRGWRLPCPVLLGQRGWFDRFPTRIDGSTTSVEVPTRCRTRRSRNGWVDPTMGCAAGRGTSTRRCRRHRLSPSLRPRRKPAGGISPVATIVRHGGHLRFLPDP